MEEIFIKIPADFKSLLDLGELVTNYKFANRLISLLNGYQKHYVDSYLMSMDDILKTIPTDQQELYKIRLSDSNREISIRKENSKERIELDKMLEAIDSGEDKVYMINHQDKIIDICFWGVLDSDKYTEDKYYYYDFGKKFKNQIWWNGTYPPFSTYVYNNKFDFEIDDNEILSFMVKYSYTGFQSVGGHWISGGNSPYLSGETRVPYNVNGYHVYHFCTKTNKYLGYRGNKEDEHRKWAKTKS